MKTKTIICLMAILIRCEIIIAKNHNVFSPDKNIEVSISNDDKGVFYSVSLDKKILLKNCRAEMNINGSKTNNFKTSKRHIHEIVNATFYRQASFSIECNELTIPIQKGQYIIFRVYNDGIAYRFVTSYKEPIIINNETADFHFANDGLSYMAYPGNLKKTFETNFQNIYTVKPLSEQSHDAAAFLPVTVEQNNSKITILESDLEAYPGMYLKESNGLHGFFAPYPKTMYRSEKHCMACVENRENYIAKVNGSRFFPWRIIAITTSDTMMPTNNLVYSLASPSRITDTSWIKPGKAVWDWWHNWNLKGIPFKAGINTNTYKYYINFAQKNGLQYIVIDEGWYNSKLGELMKPIPDIDLPELVKYGHERGIGIVLWTVYNVLDEYLEVACRKYSEMGIKGFKVDFLNRDDQTAVEMIYRIADTCAKYHLILDYHGIYKPTGMNRTYPNLLNVESVFGMEEMKWNKDNVDMPKYDVTFPYIRGMAGFVDYTPGAMHNATKKDFCPVYDNPMSMGTRCHQLATYVVFDSPFTMLADSPSNYKNNEDCVKLITSIPDVPDETRILKGEIGKYIVTARHKGKMWYIGGMTNWDSRDVTFTLPTDEHKEYEAILFSDGINAEKNAEDYTITNINCNIKSQTIHLAPGGGFVIQIKELN
jgi:alpha-glucosidase